MSDYEVRRFRPSLPGDEGYEATREWIGAVGSGFYDKRRSDDYAAKIAASYVADGRELTGAYQREPVPAGTLPAGVPVATFGTFRKTLNAGFGVLVPAHLITAVTVRTSHRRRGLLRRLMTEDLARAKADGVPVAALTASEASIYRRFGFGVATAERRITVTTGPRFGLAVPSDRRVEAADPAALLELAPEIFAKVHRVTPGSIDRQDRYRLAAGGQWDDDGGEDRALRAALHFGPAGEPDGYVTYAFRGWSHEPHTMDVHDLVAATPEAYLALWEFLGSLDLVRRVSWAEAPAEDPLAWALEDSRALKADAASDMLWLRILDVPAALTARRYGVDGTLVLEVVDGLGLAGGRYRLGVADGTASVEAADGEEPELVLDVAELASMYVGGVRATTLREAGRITETTPGAVLAADRLFAVERAARCLTHF
ncbi:GNAT family N-acetyltransferase [Sinomonas sp. ASV322]|uniref:GNAT family N-acetyltransferase n=1 Tax=Sinomonas sp. ASV322 TaxID=3041920 RepID=UPI0027DD15FB|nr:GNAT family N-acetyltransferase [Sinomonas sp. ASV322]MDQ4500940.1 GNAT family N-acetyltransferase [Sinomonas sp. ASV322]